MILLVSKENFLENDMRVCHITPANFTNHSFSPYVLTGNWDSCIIEVSEDVKTGYVPQLLKGTITTAKLSCDVEKISNKELTILTEIYPDVAAKLRFAYRRDRKSIHDILGGRLYG